MKKKKLAFCLRNGAIRIVEVDQLGGWVLSFAYRGQVVQTRAHEGMLIDRLGSREYNGYIG